MSFIKVLALAAVATVAVVVSDAAVIKLDAAPAAPFTDCKNETFAFGHCDCRSSECTTTTSICCDSKLNGRSYCAAGSNYDDAWNNLAGKEPKCFM